MDSGGQNEIANDEISPHTGGYNPWGQTTWVSEDDFVNGHMDKASDSRMPDAYAVHLPADR
ncbi:hypothetical protein ACFY1U_46120 [Streptomyces sp. NPDC001351]|uniref:hypothetical protein n=1 Tax=Streptomyces sp. NPDC001351 TaxID=3364564 RepID=UPI0036A646C9